MEKRFVRADKGYQGHYILTLDGKFYNLQDGSGGDEVTIQDYIGVEDKNGIEIFEGDIVRFKYGVSEHEVESATGGVRFDKGIFYFGDSFFAMNDGNFDEYSLEVLGNIFENPALLLK